MTRVWNGYFTSRSRMVGMTRTRIPYAMSPSPPTELDKRSAVLTAYRIDVGAPDHALEAIAKLASFSLDVPMAAISIVESDRECYRASYGFSSKEVAWPGSPCRHVVAQGEPLVVPDLRLDGRFAVPPSVPDLDGVVFYAGHPLRLQEGEVIGSLCVFDRRPRELDGRASEVMRILADEVAARLELRRKGLQLADEQSRLNTVLSAAPDAILSIDEKGKVLDANPATISLLGYSRQEIIGSEWMKHIASGAPSLPTTPGTRELISGERRAFGHGSELSLLRKDGRLVEVELTLGVMRLHGCQHWTAIVRDISRRKEAERRLHETLADLRRSRDELTQVLNQLQIGTLALNADGVIAFASDTCGQVAGMDAVLLPGQHWEEILLIDESARAALRKNLRSPSTERVRLAAQVKRDPDPRWIEIDVRDDPRNPAARMLFLYDITAIRAMRDQRRKQGNRQMIGDSEAMRELYDAIDRVAHGEWTVMIEGETGAGKELVAQAIHRASGRRDGPFVAVNCAGLTESILGSQLFGHRKGAFTGAVADQEGLFEAAHGGTLFLDEIGDVAMPIQSALLRVLQEREVTRIGETRPRKIDVRIIAATNRDLLKRVGEGLFREDLLYRLRSARVMVPPLRERRNDIPALIAAFLAEERVTGGKLVTDVSPEALEKLQQHQWPGNIRELRGVIEYAVIHCRGRRIEAVDLPSDLLRSAAPEPAAPSVAPVVSDERSRIELALQRTAGNRAKAARLLGISRATFYRRLTELGIDPGVADCE